MSPLFSVHTDCPDCPDCPDDSNELVWVGNMSEE